MMTIARPYTSLIVATTLFVTGCKREVDYSVKDIGIELGSASNMSGEIKILKSDEAAGSSTGWRVRSDQVRVSLPHFSGANALVSVLSGGDAQPGWVIVRLQYERYREIDSGGLTPVFDPRLTMPCDGWQIERKSERYPIDQGDCADQMTFGDTDHVWRNLQFRVPKAFDEFTLYSPAWQITWTLKPGDGSSFPQEASLQLPPITFHKTDERTSLDLAIR